MNTGKRLLIIILSVLLMVSLMGCGHDVSKDNHSSFSGDGQDWSWQNSSQPTGTAEQTETTNQDSENWTIMIYMIGSDLESDGGEATANLASLLEVSLPKSVRVILYTGGTRMWQNDVIDPDYNQIWSVEDGSLVLLENLDSKNTGDSRTLSEFLNYAQTNFPADKMALLLWDHGAGSVGGFGVDELYGYDSLWLSELSEALADSFTGQAFDLIGFDACLMASIETASVIEPYAKYMAASEEVEPGGGWDYTYFFSQLAQNPKMTGEGLGIAITDGYYDKYRGTTAEDIITFSVIDLSKIPALEDMLATLSEGLSGSIVQRESMSMLAKVRQNAESYGDQPGYVSLDMIDLYDFIALQKETDPTLSKSLMSAIEEAVVYEVSGAQRMYSYGLSHILPVRVKRLL